MLTVRDLLFPLLSSSKPTVDPGPTTIRDVRNVVLRTTVHITDDLPANMMSDQDESTTQTGSLFDQLLLPDGVDGKAAAETAALATSTTSSPSLFQSLSSEVKGLKHEMNYGWCCAVLSRKKK